MEVFCWLERSSGYNRGRQSRGSTLPISSRSLLVWDDRELVDWGVEALEPGRGVSELLTWGKGGRWFNSSSAGDNHSNAHLDPQGKPRPGLSRQWKLGVEKDRNCDLRDMANG